MSFRSRVAGLVAAAVAVAFLLASLVMFAATQRSLLAAVDAELLTAVGGRSSTGTTPPALAALRGLVEQRQRPVGPGGRTRPTGLAGAGGDVLRGVGLLQLVNRDGEVILTVPEGGDELPVPDDVLAVAGRGATSDVLTVRTEETAYRMIAAGVGDGFVVQVARPIDDIEEGLRRTALRLALLSLVGVGLAFVAGRLVAGRIIAPVRRLTTTAEVIAETQELAHRAEVSGDDELARLAVALNQMLDALDASRKAQQQLVADASHELRTPLTSLRTNVELLTSASRLSAADRAAMRDDLVGQIEEMTLLIGNLVDLARDGAEPAARERVDLMALVEDVVGQRQRLSPEVELQVVARPSVILGEADSLRRAVANLVDNAVKYAGEAGPVHVEVANGTVRVRDHGPGIAPADRSRVFDRFWRAPSARGAPGSGLGLAIVEQVARQHGGTAEVEDVDGPGASFVLRLPPMATDEA